MDPEPRTNSLIETWKVRHRCGPISTLESAGKEPMTAHLLERPQRPFLHASLAAYQVVRTPRHERLAKNALISVGDAEWLLPHSLQSRQRLPRNVACTHDCCFRHLHCTLVIKRGPTGPPDRQIEHELKTEWYH